jgi:hypothetical protein
MNPYNHNKGKAVLYLKIAICALALVLFYLLSGCGDSGNDTSVTNIKAGDTIESALETEDGTPLYSVTYMAYELEPGTDPVLIPENQQVSNSLVLDIQGIRAQAIYDPHNLNSINIEDVKSFLKDNWDAYIGGVEDEGMNSEELIEFLKEHFVSLPLMIKTFNESQKQGMTLSEFISTLKQADDLNLNPQEKWDVDSFLNFILDCGTTVKAFNDALSKNGYTMETFVDYMNNQNLDFNGLYDLYRKSGTTLEGLMSFFNTPIVLSLKVQQQEAQGALDVAKFAWSIIKDNRPQIVAQGAFTNVLNGKDTNWLDYQYALNSKGRELRWRGRNLFGMTLYEARFNCEATYAATHPVYGGQYLPNIHFNIVKAYAGWPWSLNASAQVSNVSNLASADNPNPQIDIVANLQAKWVFQNIYQSFSFRATGAEGIQSY